MYHDLANWQWGWAWVGTRFLAGIRTTGRVEAEHWVHKQKGLTRRSSLNEVFDVLNDRSLEQKHNEFMKRYEVFQLIRKANCIGFQNNSSILKRTRPFLQSDHGGMSALLTLYGYKTIFKELHAALAIHDVREVSIPSADNDNDNDNDLSSMVFDPLDKLTGSEVHLIRTQD